MLRLLPMLLFLGLALVALIDCLSYDDDEIRGLPKIIWVFVILLFSPVGPVAWYFAGRPRKAESGTGTSWRLPGRSGEPPRRNRPLAPDDDPDFLRGLGERRRTDDDGEPRTDP